MLRNAAAAVGVVALGLACFGAGEAGARTIYDGSWSVLISGRTGNCAGGAWRFAVTIANGVIGYGDASIRGRVGRGGAVVVKVSAGDQRASGSGRLSRHLGSGVWRGASSQGACAGVWSAQRHP